MNNQAIIIREDRRRQVCQMLQQSMSETEIAQRLGVSKATISRDIQHLKAVANQLITSLALWYKDLLEDTTRARLKAWSIYDSSKDEQRKLNALKIVITSNESIFKLLEAGPTVMSVRAIQEQLNLLLERDSRGQEQA